MISKKLSNKVAVITGAARGIGSAIAKRFAAEGALVVINYASREKDAERTMAAIQAKGGVAITFQADITKASAVEQLFTAANERFGRIDILVNKAAVDAITATLALELGPNGIRVNAINPGMVKTEGLDELSFITPEFRNQIAAMTPLRRLGEPDDIAAAAVLFCSEDAGWITGECIRVSGGLI
jgi:NAD(P)-dependent dehydrogenase (short-subunit alcohol dehydrogenase family)